MHQVNLGSRYQKIEYSGKFSSYQLYGNSEYQFERDEFNAYQNFLYKRALFGLSVYSDKELSIMHWDKKSRIQKVHSRTQNVLNLWKQELSSNFINDLFSSMFWNSKFVSKMIEAYPKDQDPFFTSKMDFKSLGLSKKQIVNKLIEERILPYNFYQLQ
jgi:hypothetical protein